MHHSSKMKWRFTAVVWENPDNTLIYNIFSKLLKVFSKSVYPMELSLKKIALSLPHSTCHAEQNSIFWSIAWQQHTIFLWSSTPGQFNSSLLWETIPHRKWKESYMKKAGAVTFSPACSTQKLYQFWNQENDFLYCLLKRTKIIRETETVGWYICSLRCWVLRCWGLLWNTVVFHLPGDFLLFFIIEDCLVCTNQISTENCASINPNKMPCHKKAVEDDFYPPPSYLSSSVSEIIIWRTALLVCYHSGDSQGRVKSLRRKIMVTITAMFMAVSQIQ